MKGKPKISPSTGLSFTALSVIAAFERALRTAEGKFFDDIERPVTRHFIDTAIAAETNWFHWCLERSIPKAPNWIQQSFFNNFVAAGYDHLMLTRKLMIRNLIRNALFDDNVEQIVILAGGYDPRAILESMRLKNLDIKNKRIFELDRGKTREIKLEALKSLPEALGLSDYKMVVNDDRTSVINDNLYLIEYDVKDNLTEKLCQNGFQKGRKTLVIAEGLTIYLNEAGARQLLTSVADLIAENDEFFLSFNTSTKSSFTEKAAISSSNEPYKFSLTPELVLPFAAISGFEVTGLIRHQDRLHFIGDWENANRYKDEMGNLKDEIYYSLRKSAGLLKEKQLSDIPILDMRLSALDDNCMTPLSLSSAK